MKKPNRQKASPWTLPRYYQEWSPAKVVSAKLPNDDSTAGEIFWAADYLAQLLAHKAKSDDAYAAQKLADLALSATAALTNIARDKAELLRPYARESDAWPVIKSKREKLSDDEKDLFAGIQLGEDAIIELDPPTARWKWDDAGQISYSLLRRIELARAGSRHPPLDFGEIGKRAKRLPEFCDRTWLAWWEEARRIFLASYPEPQNVEVLNRLVTAATKRKSPGRIKAAILDMLRCRFLSFARDTSYQI
jgi:hypothetical protein